MPRFVWKATHAGAPDPDNKEYAEANDDLFVRDDTETDTRMRSFGRAKKGRHGVETPLSGAIES